MSVNKNGNLRADGISVSLPTLFGRLGGTYYWNPGAPGAPPFTVTRSFGIPGFGAHWVHLRPGLSSKDTLGKGITGNVSVGIPSVSVNGATPDGWFSPGKAKEIAVEWGIGSPNASPALTKTYSPAQIADLINTYIFPPAMGPLDELSPFARTLQSGIARVAPSAEQPLPYMRAPSQGPLGGWRRALGVRLSEGAVRAAERSNCKPRLRFVLRLARDTRTLFTGCIPKRAWWSPRLDRVGHRKRSVRPGAIPAAGRWPARHDPGLHAR